MLDMWYVIVVLGMSPTRPALSTEMGTEYLFRTGIRRHSGNSSHVSLEKCLFKYLTMGKHWTNLLQTLSQFPNLSQPITLSCSHYTTLMPRSSLLILQHIPAVEILQRARLWPDFIPLLSTLVHSVLSQFSCLPDVMLFVQTIPQTSVA